MPPFYQPLSPWSTSIDGTRYREGVRPSRLVASLAAVLMVVLALTLPGFAGVASAAPACGPSYSNPVVDTPWPLTRLRPDLAWPLSRGRGVVVAVIDSGVSTAPPSLKGQVIQPGKDFVDPKGTGNCDLAAHGTFVAGIVAGHKLTGVGFYGVAPEARILPVRVLEDEQKSFDDQLPAKIAAAIDFAVNKGADVINLSLVTENTAAMRNAINNALAKNVVVVAAAGNDGASQNKDAVSYPAAYPGVIAVAGIDENDQHVQTSTSGDYVDVAAPGVNIVGPAPQGGGFGQFPSGGTSFAAAYVSGVAALVRSYDRSLSVTQVTDRITSTADHPPDGHNAQVGYGVVNPYRAVAAITGKGAAGPAGPKQVALAGRKADPMHGARLAAIWIAFAGAGLTVALWVGIGVVRRGRRRQWRAGRLSASAAGLPSVTMPTEPSGSLTVRAPTVRRSQAERGLAAEERRGISMPGATTGKNL
jgi:membrane-anchored mycosin MYCP